MEIPQKWFDSIESCFTKKDSLGTKDFRFRNFYGPSRSALDITNMKVVIRVDHYPYEYGEVLKFYVK